MNIKATASESNVVQIINNLQYELTELDALIADLTFRTEIVRGIDADRPIEPSKIIEPECALSSMITLQLNTVLDMKYRINAIIRTLEV